ncbi:MAG TPA: cytochrome c biogenesis protein CcdA, partial [Chloroflexota bacterium]
PIFGKSRRTGPVGSALMGFTFAAGCLSCFSATVLPTLLLYASAVGSVAYGALLLLIFSLGISIPALVLALGVSHSGRLMAWLQRNSSKLTLASAAVMAGFGLLMVTYTYHIATGLLAKLL